MNYDKEITLEDIAKQLNYVLIELKNMREDNKFHKIFAYDCNRAIQELAAKIEPPEASNSLVVRTFHIIVAISTALAITTAALLILPSAT